MSRPVLVAVDDDPAALGVLEQELRKRYGADYLVACQVDPRAALQALERIQADGGQVALVLADQWMPAMTGVQLLRGPCVVSLPAVLLVLRPSERMFR
jgi:thioredoxin reductase (NADPH)